MDKDPIGMKIEALHRELDAYQQKNDDASWILVVRKKEEGAVTSIGGMTRDIIALITQVIVSMSLEEDDPVDYANRITAMLSEVTPEGVKIMMEHRGTGGKDNEGTKVKDAVSNLLKALKDEMDD